MVAAVLITGGTGFLGSALARQLNERNVDVTILPVKDQLERADVTIWDFISRHLDVQYTPPVVAAAVDVVGPGRTRSAPRARRVPRAWPVAQRRRHPEASDRSRLGRLRRIRRNPIRPTRRGASRRWGRHPCGRLGGWRLAPQLLVEQLAGHGRLEVDSLVLVPRRQRRHLNAQLRDLGDCPEILVHPDDAAQHGIEEGADVCVRSASAEIRDPVRIDALVGRGHVSVPHGWDVTNVNVLTTGCCSAQVHSTQGSIGRSNSSSTSSRARCVRPGRSISTDCSASPLLRSTSWWRSQNAPSWMIRPR